MSDALSLAASIAGIIAISVHATNVVTQFIGDTRSAPKSIVSLGTELVILGNILEQVQAMAESWTLQSPILQSLVMGQILEGVRLDIEALSEILSIHTATPGDSVLRQGWKQVQWVLCEPEIADRRRSIEAYKSSLLLTLAVANCPDPRTTEITLAEITEIRNSLADVRTLCNQLMNRHRSVSRIVTSSLSRRQLRANESTISLAVLTPIGTNQTTASVFSTRSNRSVGSITSVASSYWAASIIYQYCTELQQFSGLYAELEVSASAVPTTQKSDTVQNQLGLPTRPISQGDSPREMAVKVDRRALLITPAPPRRRFPWTTAPIYRPVIQIPTASTKGLYNPADVRFFPTPELVPGVFTPVPGLHATAIERDDYIRRCVERNANFVMGEWIRWLGSPIEIGNPMAVTLRIMKKFWRCYALYLLDPSTSAIRGFSSPKLPKLWIPLLRVCGFLVADPERGPPPDRLKSEVQWLLPKRAERVVRGTTPGWMGV